MRKRLSVYLSHLRPHVRTVGIVLVVLALAVAWYWFLWQPASALLDPKDRVTAQDEAFRTLLQLIGGVAILFGGYTAWRTLRATQRTVEATEKQVEATQKQVEIAREGQITDRFNKAVEHLGSDDLTIRLGGIYALERIAEDSETHHWPVMEVLTAFVRENAPRKPKEQEFEQVESAARTTTSGDEIAKPYTDIQAILTVLGRRSVHYEKAEQKLDLNAAHLRGADLREANLRRVDLTDADLSKADLSEADLSKARLNGAILIQAKVWGAIFRKANLRDAILALANLSEAGFSEVNLSGAILIGANLSEAILDSSNLTAADCRGADFSGADLEDANFTGADFSGADFSEANLASAYICDKNGNAQVVTNEYLAGTKSLKGATMPDGSEHA